MMLLKKQKWMLRLMIETCQQMCIKIERGQSRKREYLYIEVENKKIKIFVLCVYFISPHCGYGDEQPRAGAK